jgi:hypothetical protein
MPTAVFKTAALSRSAIPPGNKHAFLSAFQTGAYGYDPFPLLSGVDSTIADESWVQYNWSWRPPRRPLDYRPLDDVTENIQVVAGLAEAEYLTACLKI